MLVNIYYFLIEICYRHFALCSDYVYINLVHVDVNQTEARDEAIRQPRNLLS